MEVEMDSRNILSIISREVNKFPIRIITVAGD